MADGEPTLHRARAADTELPAVSADDFQEGFGEPLSGALNLDTWRDGSDVADEYRRLEEEVLRAVAAETDLEADIRRRVFPALDRVPGAPPGAGHYFVAPAELEQVRRGLLLNGGTDACDGTCQVFETLPLTAYQIGVGLVSYQGGQGVWRQQLFRRDLHCRRADPVADALDLLERRARPRSGRPADRLPELARKAIRSFAERAVLVRRSQGRWRMGHGSPAPHELLDGAGSPDLMIESIRIIRELVEGHRRFLFVSGPGDDNLLWTVGNALRPLEFAIVRTLDELLDTFLDAVEFWTAPTVDDRWDGERLSPARWLIRFRDQVASQVVVGVFRASLLAKPRVFYAHAEYADVAARLALADSIFQQTNGYPLLLDLAARTCHPPAGLAEMVATAGMPARYSAAADGR